MNMLQLAKFCVSLLDNATNIGPVETFHRQHGDIQSHHRNALDLVTQDELCKCKWNARQLKKFGFE